MDIINVLGYLGLTCFLLSLLVKNPRQTALRQAAGESFYILHFLGLGTPMLALTSLSVIGRNLLTCYAPRTYLIAYIIIMLGTVSATALLWGQTPMAYLAAFGLAISSSAMLYRDKFWTFRLILLASQGIWLASFILAGSEPSIFKNILCISFNLIKMAQVFQEEHKAKQPAPVLKLEQQAA